MPRSARLILLPTLAALAGACVGTNPDWDGPRSGGSSGGSSGAPADVETSSDASGSTAPADTGATPTSTESGETEPCLAQGLARCEGDGLTVCVDLTSDDRHCGACFSDCAAISGSTCVDAQCRCPDEEWWVVCDGACTKVKDDPHACGETCTDCTVELGDHARCKNGACEEH